MKLYKNNETIKLVINQMDDKKRSIEKEPKKAQHIKDYEDVLNANKLRFFPTSDYNSQLKSLNNPRFLGSYHLKEENTPKYNSIKSLMKGDLDVKYAKALRGTLINPVTIALIIIALLFNILWFFFI
jgi:hypothetical protein